MIKAVVNSVELSADGENVYTTVMFLDDEGTHLTPSPAVFTQGLEEAEIPENLQELIRGRAAQIAEEQERIAAIAKKAEEYAATTLAELKRDLEDRAFDATDTTELPVKIDFTKAQLEAKDAAAASAQADSKED